MFEKDTRLIDLSAGELRQIVRDELKQLLSEVLPNLAGESVNTIPIEKLSELTGWSKSTIYKKCSQREIPHHKVGKELRFNLEEVNNWICSLRRNTKTEVVNAFEKRSQLKYRKTG